MVAADDEGDFWGLVDGCSTVLRAKMDGMVWTSKTVGVFLKPWSIDTRLGGSLALALLCKVTSACYGCEVILTKETTRVGKREVSRGDPL